MSEQIGIFEAKNRLSELVRSAQSGNEIIITLRGKPMAKLVPVEEAPAMSRQEALQALQEFGRKYPLKLKKGETLKDMIAKGRK